MDATLKTVCALLESPDNMRRCAAAIVLGTLAPKDTGVVKALGAALPGADSMLTPYLLEALTSIGSPEAAPLVLPLLDAESLETKLRAAALVAKAGPAVVPQIRERLAQASPAQKPVLVDVLARIHGREAFAAILDVLPDPDFELVKQACEAVRRHLAEVAPKDRAALHKAVVAFMKAPRARAQERVLTSCLLLLGYIGRPEARAILLQHAAPACSLYVRRHALIGLKNLELTGAVAAALGREVTAYLDDPDDGIVRHVLDILARIPSFGAAAAPWRKLLVSRQPAVRAFAVRRLAEHDDAATNRDLLDLLQHEDTDLREVAASALATHKAASRLLLEALAKAGDAGQAWQLAKILKPHSEAVDAKVRKQFIALAARDLLAGSPRYEALLYFLRNLDPKAAETVLLEAGMEHRRAKRWAQAVECLRRLVSTESFDDETRFALTVCNLKVSLKDLAPQARAEDHALRGIQALLRNKAFKLFERLKKEKVLDASDLYYVGFHFAESVGEDQPFGIKILELVAKTWPKSAEGKAAKNKLKLAAKR